MGNSATQRFSRTLPKTADHLKPISNPGPDRILSILLSCQTPPSPRSDA